MAPSALATGLGTYHRTISCPGEELAAWFDEGLRLYYAFDLDGSERAFRRAAERGDCAIAEWGVALALGPNINLPQLADRRERASEAIQRARALAARHAPTEVEAGLIEALALRHAGADVPAGDRAYAAAMRRLRAHHAVDPDVAALAAAALLELRPWGQWGPDGKPAPETPELVGLLERSLARAPTHPGLVHYYLHTMESSPHPERALEAARRIGTMMPAAGHLVHMPSHIFLRTGRYAEAADWNRRAIEADQAWQAQGRAGPLYQMYILHNHHFLWLADLALARETEARREAELLRRACTKEALVGMPAMAFLLALPAISAVRFSRWDEVLAMEAPPEAYGFARGLFLYARARAYAALGRLKEAGRDTTELEAIAGRPELEAMVGASSGRAVLAVAIDAAKGATAARAGKVAEAVRFLRAAVKREDALAYEEPPVWSLPTRQLLGQVLLETRRYPEAAQVFTEDLQHNRENGWSLEGLERALRGQGDPRGAAAVGLRRARAFALAQPPRVGTE